jgi:hypothetical protein
MIAANPFVISGGCGWREINERVNMPF